MPNYMYETGTYVPECRSKTLNSVRYALSYNILMPNWLWNCIFVILWSSYLDMGSSPALKPHAQHIQRPMFLSTLHHTEGGSSTILWHSVLRMSLFLHPTLIFDIFCSASASSMAALKQPTIRVVAIIAEGVPESDTKQLIAYARANNKVTAIAHSLINVLA